MDGLLTTAREWLSNPAILAGAWVAGGLIAAKIAEWVLVRVVLRLTRKTHTDLDDRIAEDLRRPVFVTVLAFGLFGALEAIGIVGAPRFAALGVIRSVGVLVWAVALGRIGILVLRSAAARTDRLAWVETRTLPLFENSWKLIIAGGVVYLLLNAWSLDVKPWLASAGIAGIALGFAAKDTLANLFSGLFILADAPYQIGDFIVLDGGERGRVTAIGLRSTRIVTRDDVEVTLPNAVIANAKILNESGGPSPKARVTVHVGVAYGSDIDLVRETLLSAAADVEQVTSDPAPRVRFLSLIHISEPTRRRDSSRMPSSA